MSDRPPEPIPPPKPPRTPDVLKIAQLVKLMQRYDLTAIDLGEGPNKIRLRRRGHEAPPPPPPPPPPAHHTGQATPAPTAAPGAPKAAEGILIKSPMVGTFYASSAPDAPAFVSVGSVVNPKTIVCIIEAMKVFTDIPAEISGSIAEVLVKNGQPVEFDQPLFRVTQG
jgi:acetyl-CoA carboxylase biotin carboxyl carrier protein